MAGAGGAENYAAMGAILREIVDEAVAKIIPDHAVLQKMTPFNKDPEPQGLKHVQATLCRYPDGFSHVVAGTGPAELNPAKAGKIERAEVQSNSIYLVDTIDKDMIDRTKGDSGKFNKPAVKKATAVLFPALIAAAKREEEIVTLYGQSGRGKMSTPGSNCTTVTTNGPSQTQCVIDKAEWGPGLWSGMEGTDLNLFDDGNNGAFLGTMTIYSINMDTRALIFSTNNTTAIAAATGPVSFWRASTRKPVSGAAQLTESIGMHGILTNTGTLFNINAALYNLYKSPQYAVGGVSLSVGKLMGMSSRASYNGTGSGAVFLVPIDSWTDLATTETTYRRWMDGGVGQLKIGPDALVFHGATGVLAVKAHPMLKRGYTMFLNLAANSETPGGDIKRIGDLEWEYDNTNGDVLHYVPGLSGYEIRLKCNKAVFANPPGRSLIGTGIVDGQN